MILRLALQAHLLLLEGAFVLHSTRINEYAAEFLLPVSFCFL